MATEMIDVSRTVVRRIFVMQSSLIVSLVTLILVSDAMNIERFGFDFWFAFFGGCIGSSISLIRRIKSDEKLLQELGRSTVDTLIPVLYGGILAGLTYVLFLSGILSGASGDGLLTTNLFPTFKFQGDTAEPESLVRAFLRSKPATVSDLGKLVVWCFIAGYSEKFVVGILSQLDARTESDKTPAPSPVETEKPKT